MGRIRKRLSSSQIIILGFAAVILLGSLLLMLPFATRDGNGAIFTDALFTATSAVCVTGLIVQDTATYWSTFGQAVIITLIQIGGMGVVTVAIAVSTLSGKQISLKQRSTMLANANMRRRLRSMNSHGKRKAIKSQDLPMPWMVLQRYMSS